MELSEAGNARPPASPADRLERISSAARGWHSIQLAVLGFIGICGILRTASSPVPRVVQWLAAALAVAALAAACAAIFTVGRVAYPVSDTADGAGAMPGAAAARLRAGIRLTIVALILAVIAALSGWWPAAGTSTSTPAAAVAVTAASGQAWCGPLVSGPAGAVSVRTAHGIITVPAQDIAQVSPAAQC